MALVLIQNTKFGPVLYQQYLAENSGDGFPLHDHHFNHLTFAIKGTIECYTDDGKSIRLNPGDAPVEYAVGRKHGIRAVTDGAIFMNTMPAFDGA